MLRITCRKWTSSSPNRDNRIYVDESTSKSSIKKRGSFITVEVCLTKRVELESSEISRR